jgi:hypothetical protein
MIPDATADVLSGAKNTLAEAAPTTENVQGNPLSAFNILKFRGHIPGIKAAPQHEFSHAPYSMARKIGGIKSTMV